MFETPGAPRPVIADLVRQQYLEAIAFPSVAAEARIRLSWMLYRVGSPDEAVSQLMQAGGAPLPDPELRYLQQLFLGHVFGATGDHDRSIAAYRAAAAMLPGAQSARVGLMNTLLLRDERAEAEALAEYIQTTRDQSQDPWWSVLAGAVPHAPAGPAAAAGDGEMNPRATALVLLAAVVAALPGERIGAQEQLPTFRSMANAVAVDVTVRDSKRKSVTGLKASDFEVYDNGIRQEVAEVSYGKLPIDVTVALDVSFSVTGLMLERLR